MKKEFVRKVVVFENHFKEFRKTLDRETLKKFYQVLTLIMMVKEIPDSMICFLERLHFNRKKDG